MSNVIDLKMAAAGDEQNPDSPTYSFDDFWRAYPKRTARKDALKAWGKVAAEHYPQIFAAIAQFKKTDDWRRDGGRYIPMPATWINGERWTDELQSDLTMGECSWNVNGNREPGKPKCAQPGAREKNGIPYCTAHAVKVNG